MGLLRLVKKQIVTRSMDKRKRENVFNIEEADNYILPADAPSRYNNSHYFTLHNHETKECLFFRSALRGGTDTDELWLFIKTKDGRIYLQSDDHIEKGAANPVKTEVIKAGEQLKFYYDGEVNEGILNADGSITKGDVKKHISLCGVFNANTEPFEFSTHMASKTMARAMSREKFNKSFQDAMKAIHQIHYEQGGISSVEFTVDGVKTEFKDFASIRDHSYGRRDWNYFDRYVWTIIMMEDGSVIHTSMMRYPAMKNLQAGFCIKDGQALSLYYSSELDLLKPMGNCPEEFELEAHYVDGSVKKIKAKRDYFVPYYFDDNYNVNEGVYEYEIDGVKGRGIGEFAFNADITRWTGK